MTITCKLQVKSIFDFIIHNPSVYLFCRYFFPTYENDSLLCALDDDDDDDETMTTKQYSSTPIIAEDIPVKEDSILLTDKTMLQDLKGL